MIKKILRFARATTLALLPGGPRRCVLCDRKTWKFLPYQGGSKDQPPLIRELDAVGSDVDHFSCPHCRGHDRERHLLMFLQSSGILEAMRGKTIMHFAPEPQLSSWIAAVAPLRYIRCDLEPTSPDIQRIDMLAIDAESESFDFLIANHVLEHVADDRRALQEIHRVLKDGGHAILQTPFARKLRTTWEDHGITDGRARLQAYGQADHVRLYGSDIFERFTLSGLESLVRQHAELLPGTDAAALGINPDEPFFLFRKRT